MADEGNEQKREKYFPTRTSLEFPINEADLNLFDPKIKQLNEYINRENLFYIFPQVREIVAEHLCQRFEDAVLNERDRGKFTFIYGAKNTGKTLLLFYAEDFLRKQYPMCWEEEGYIFPVIYLKLDVLINTGTQLMTYILKKLGDPVSYEQNRAYKNTNLEADYLFERVITRLKKLKTRILFLDESQLIMKARNSNLVDIFEVIKKFTHKSNWTGNLRTHFVLCGTNECYTMLEADDWIQERIYLINFQPLEEEDYTIFVSEIYKDLIKAGISRDWKVITDQKKTNKEFILYLLNKTQGRVGATVLLIKEAIQKALARGQLYPSQNDFDACEVNLDIKLKNLPQLEISATDTMCKVKNCRYNRKIYKKFNNLLQHYKNIHYNEVEVVNSSKQRIS